MLLRALTKEDVTITVDALPEDEDPSGCFALGDDAADAAMVAKIREESRWNVWAWCTIRVRVAWRGHKADAYLGCCSYESREDFIAADDYYGGMVSEALDRLNEDIAREFADLQDLAILGTLVANNQLVWGPNAPEVE